MERISTEKQAIDSLIRLYKDKRTNEAIEEANKLTTIFPKSFQVWNLLGIFSAQMNNLSVSEKAFRKAVRFNSKYADAHSNLGNILRARGKVEEAIKCYKFSLKLNPNFAEAHNNLGNMLKDKNNVADAIKCYREAIRIKPHYAEAYNNLGHSLKEQRNLDEAFSCLEKAIKLKPHYAEAHNNLGNVLKEKGYFDEAAISFNEALRMDPKYEKAYINLGNLLREKGERFEAISLLKQVIKLNKNLWEAHYILGSCLQELNRINEAMNSYNMAIQIDPKNALAFHGMGTCHQQKGNFSEAMESYKTAIGLKPDFAKCHRTISNLKKYTLGDPHAKQMEDLYQNNDIEDSERSQICFALAKVFEDLGELEKAFRFLKEGNTIQREVLNYNYQQDKEIFSRIKKAFGIFRKHRIECKDGTSNPRPIFILGMPRSGTTLVERIISSHSKVKGAGELALLSYHGKSLAIGESKSDGKSLVQLRTAYLKHLQSLANQSAYITDKMPHNFQYIGLIFCTLPEAKVIHVTRDPKATCWSNYKVSFSGEDLRYSYDLTDIVKYYKLYQDLMKFWNHHFPRRIYNLDYDKLTVDQNIETKNLLNYIGLEWEDSCLNPENNTQNILTASITQARKKVYKGSSKHWLKFEPFIGNVFDKLGQH